MADATYAIPNFLGGEVSDFAQGRFDKPEYRVSLNVCLNSFPTESGSWTRRPGTKHGGPTRRGAPGRTIKFDFEQSAAITMEFTDGKMRFRAGTRLLTTNDFRTVQAISSANPAVMSLYDAVTWATDDVVLFDMLGDARGALLQARQIKLTKVDTTHFELSDAMSGDAIDGATIGAITPAARADHIQEVDTPYTNGSWSDVRAVQAETTGFLLSPDAAPQALTVETMPADGVDAQFDLSPAVLLDGPYLDPFTNGVQATPTATSGIISLQLSFPAYSSTKAYKAGDFVTSVGVNYVSIVDQNVNNTPAASPTKWTATSASAAINDGQGFLGTDVGRLVRLLSEPPAWSAATTYAATNKVSYNPSGEPGAATYWQSLTSSNTGNAPGSDLTNWSQLSASAAIWSWGRITGLSNVIDRALAGSTSIGDMTGGGGLNAAFNGTFSQAAGSSAVEAGSSGFSPAGSVFTLQSYVGKNYSGASDQAIQQATVYPSSDIGMAYGTFTVGGSGGGSLWGLDVSFVINLRGKATAPASPSDGTLLGTSGTQTKTTQPVTVISNDQTTAWKYVWVELVTSFSIGGALSSSSANYTNAIAQVSFFNPTGTGTSAGANVEILGPALLYTNPIATWRLGVYSNTTGWPTCGCFDGGRLFLGGAIPNRWDACYANGVAGGTVNFAPTNQYGVVSAASAISYVFNSDSVNQIVWMQPDLQGIIMGTQGGEWLVRAPTNGALAPNNVDARRVTKIGCADIEPRRTEHTTVFIKRYGRKLMEYFPDVYSGKFSAPNLADKAQHIPRSGMAELAYTEAINSIIWGRCNDGSWFGISYRRDALASAQGPTYYAWHRQALGSGRIVESICSGPSVGGDLDTVTMVTNDVDSGQHHVEILTDVPDEESELSEAWFLDNAVNPTSISIDPVNGVTINGLWHLNGKTVQVFAGGLDCGDRGDTEVITDFTVTDGSLLVPFGDGVSAGPGGGLFTAVFAVGLALTEFVIGFTYNSDGQLLRPITAADSGARNGPALGKTRRNHQFSALVVNSKGLWFGTTFDTLRPAQFRQANGNPIDAQTTYSGVHHDTIDDDYSYDGMVCWRVSRPYPANIAAVSGNIQTQDR
jgi:hypothetical protein